MKIINSKTRRGTGHNMHRITVEFADGRKTNAVLYSAPVGGEYRCYISLVAACKIAGVSEEKYRDYVRNCKLDTPYTTIPVEINGTMQARKMVFTRAFDMAWFLRHQGEEYRDICAWFYSISTSPLDAVMGFDAVMNPVEAKRAGLLSIPVDEPAPPQPVAPVSIDFDATGGIEQLNRVISSLDVPYQVRARALSIQNDFSQLANTIDLLNTTGKAA
jgi:hypothetical protein|nr:MAG TPA: hypothetical protein [Caudoviricetes sp.]